MVGLVLICVLAPLSWLLVRSTPEACGLEMEPEGPGQQERQGQVSDASLGEALRTPAFWAFGLATSLFGLVWSAITLFTESILKEQGFGAGTFHLVMALLTAGGLVSNLLGGWLAKRWPLGSLLGFGMLPLAGALACFPGIVTQAGVILYGLALGVAGGLITVVHFTFYGQAFGRAHLGRIQGAAQVLSVVTSALGPLTLAACHEWIGHYDLLFYGAAPLAVLLGLWVWSVALPGKQVSAKGSV
jgi:MFS family permease